MRRDRSIKLLGEGSPGRGSQWQGQIPERPWVSQSPQEGSEQLGGRRDFQKPEGERTGEKQPVWKTQIPGSASSAPPWGHSVQGP